MKHIFLFLNISLTALYFPVFGQNSPFDTPKARKDSALIVQYLVQSQLYLDSSNFVAALQWARDAEQILHTYGIESSPLLSDAYCLQGLSLIKTNRGAAFDLWRKVEALPESENKLAQANVLYFMGTCHLYSNSIPQTKEIYQKAIQYYNALPQPFHSNLGRIYSNLGYIAIQEKNLPEAIQYANQAIDIWTKNQGPFFPALAHPFNNRGLAHYEQGNYKVALADYRKALNIRKKNLAPNHPDMASSLNNLGLLSYEQGALKDARIYFLRALEISKAMQDTISLGKIANNLGMISARLQDFAESRVFYTQTLAIEKANPRTKKSDIATTLYNIGVAWREEEQYQQALEYFYAAQKMLGKKHHNYTNVISAIGRCLEASGQYPAALEQYELAYALELEKYGAGHPMLATYLYNQASIWMLTGNLPKAIEQNLQAQQILGYREGVQFSTITLLPQLCNILTQSSQLAYLSIRSEQDTLGLQKALHTAHQSLLAYEYFSLINADPKVKLVAKAASLTTVDIAIACNYQLYRQTQNLSYAYAAFHHAERSKSSMLLESIQKDQIVQNSQASPALMHQEAFLRKEIAEKDVFIQEQLAKKASPLDSILVQATLKRDVLMAEYDTIFQKIVQNDSRFILRTESVDSIQKSLLTPEQTLLSYYVGQNDFYIFLVQSHHFECIKRPLDFPLAAWVDSLRQGIYSYYAFPSHHRTVPLAKSVQEYTHYAQQLFQKLIQPVYDSLTSDIIIIPDGLLGNVPFEALLTKTPARMGNFTTYDFLLEEKSISYNYSASMMRQMTEKKHMPPPDRSVLALAPFFREDSLGLQIQIDSTDELASINLRDALEPLKQSGEEAKQVAKLWQGNAVLGIEASIQNFWESAPHYRILHLSTHGKADNRRGDLAYLAMGALSDTMAYEKLYARNLYEAKFRADVAVLSACETSVGKLYPGEGIGSLAHAFAHAGAKSLITSLWKVDEKSSTTILLDFHYNLKAGKPKDAALRQAKLDYLTQKKKNEISEMHPFFWAGFIAIGDMRAIR